MHRGAIPLMLVGATLVATLTLGVVLAATHFYADHRGFAGAIDPRLIDLGSLAANAGLLTVLFRLGRFSRESNDDREAET